MNKFKKSPYIRTLCIESPKAIAKIQGNRLYSDLTGIASFYETDTGVLVSIWIENLPENNQCSSSIFACHIHDGKNCNESDGNYTQAGNHLNLDDCKHPYHGGDFPPLFSLEDHSSFLCFVTSRFTINDIIGKVIIIHYSFDDFTTHPSGNSGNMIACGKILRIRIKQ